MQPFEEIKIKIPSGTVHALAYGPTDGYPILAIHGWLDNAASFIPIAAHFPQFRFVAIDLIGHGHSDHPAPGSYFHFVDYIADVAAIIDSCGWQQCGLLGHSLGAGIATIVAAVLPERVSTLALIDGLGPITITSDQLPDLMRKSLHDYARLNNKKLPIYATINEAVNVRLAVSKMTSKSVELLVERGIKKVAGGYTWRTDPRLLCSSLIMITEDEIPPFLKRIVCDTLLIRPSHGWPFDEKVFSQRVKYLNNIEIHKIAGEHHVHMDKPDEIGPILEEFFTRNI